MAAANKESATLHNGVAMPWLGLGTFRAQDGAEVERAVGWALQAGYRSIDTASAYDNEAGVGRAIRESHLPREEIFVTTKVWNSEQGFTETLHAFEKSLQRLDMDYVDLYLIHWPVPEEMVATWQALEALYRDGRARAIGVCNFLVHHLQELLHHAEIPPMVNQVEFHPRLQQPELRLFCQEHEIQLEAWSPLMKGKVLDIPELQRIGEQHGKSAAQVALRWQRQHNVVTIPKSTHRDRIELNAELFNFELTPEEMRQIDDLDRGERIGPHPDTFSP